MTAQEIYTGSKTGLLAQNCKARDQHGACRLRVTMDDGIVRKCAIGQNIPDPVYLMLMDECRVTDLPHEFPQTVPYVVPSDIWLEKQREFIEDLQHIHDRHNPEDWSDEFRRFAYKWELIP